MVQPASAETLFSLLLSIPSMVVQPGSGWILANCLIPTRRPVDDCLTLLCFFHFVALSLCRFVAPSFNLTSRHLTFIQRSKNLAYNNSSLIFKTSCAGMTCHTSRIFCPKIAIISIIYLIKYFHSFNYIYL